MRGAGQRTAWARRAAVGVVAAMRAGAGGRRCREPRAGRGACCSPAPPDLGPPDWVQPGTRLSFYAAGASVANADFQWQESEDGTWEDPVTGKRYKQVDAPTAGGEGIFQLDVVAIDGPDVAVQWTLLGLDRGAGRFFSGATGGARETGAAPEDFWIHPDLLAAVPSTDLPDLRILRGPYTAADGATYAAIALLRPRPERVRVPALGHVSGVLLSTTTRTQGNASPLHVEGQDPPEANTQLTIGRYLGTRQRDGAALLAATARMGDSPGCDSSTRARGRS